MNKTRWNNVTNFLNFTRYINSTRWVDMVRYINQTNIINSTRMLTKVMTDPNYRPSESELKKSLSLLALHNAIVIKNMNNMVIDKFA